jgi:4-amino-4-deoxy-L-arabinose transferase-like glycosyltransferase
VSFARSVDPVFIFGLTNQPYYDAYYPSPLPFWQFPLFVIAAVILIRKWNRKKRMIKYLLFALVFSLLFSSLFLSSFLLKYIPLVVTIELITGFGLGYFLSEFKKLWQRN